MLARLRQRQYWVGLILLGSVIVSPAGDADTLAECVQRVEAVIVSQARLDAEFGDNCDGECPAAVITPSLVELCPGQVATVIQHPWSGGLVRGADELILADLTGLDLLYQSYRANSAYPVVDPRAVKAVLATLELPPPESPSWWQMAWQSIMDWFGNEKPQMPGWLEHVSISDVAVKAIMYGAIALVVLLALVIVGVELRLGLAHRRRTAASVWDETRPMSDAPMTFEALAQAPLREQPGLLLALVLAHLQASGELQVRRTSCTHREIAAAAVGLKHGAAVGQISAAAEQAIFGNWYPDKDAMQALLNTGLDICRPADRSRQ